MGHVHETEWFYYRRKEDTFDRCSWCGSMGPKDAIRLLDRVDARGSGSDWKYGWPHKFYIETEGHGKFYSVHLYDATPEEFEKLSGLIHAKLGIKFSIDKQRERLKYEYPYPGYQTWIGYGDMDKVAPRAGQGDGEWVN